MNPIMMAEEYWANTQLSVARYTGSIKAFGNTYTVCDKYGRTVFETSIPPGEPADLVREDFIPFYRKLGRDKFIEEIQRRKELTKTELLAHFKELTRRKESKDKSKQTTLEL